MIPSVFNGFWESGNFHILKSYHFHAQYSPLNYLNKWPQSHTCNHNFRINYQWCPTYSQQPNRYLYWSWIFLLALSCYFGIYGTTHVNTLGRSYMHVITFPTQLRMPQRHIPTRQSALPDSPVFTEIDEPLEPTLVEQAGINTCREEST